MRFSRSLAVTLGALGVLIASSCNGRTFKIVDTATGNPLSGVRAHFVARATFPISIAHPWEFTLAEWQLDSDDNGEMVLLSIWAVTPAGPTWAHLRTSGAPHRA
jgi:hypothetical protein